MSNEDWNIIASMPSLTYIRLIDNDFETNFSEITIDTNTISTIEHLRIGINNDFYGTIDVNTNGFFSHFPNLKRIMFEALDIAGHFDNFDAFSSDFMPGLYHVNIENNEFTGSITLSDAVSFNSGLQRFTVDENDFNGNVNWKIFDKLYDLEMLQLHGNSLSGSINWTIIGDLHQNGSLSSVNLQNNQFTGYADFTWIVGDIWLALDPTLQCQLE